MGLDISYGKNITPAPDAERDENGELVDWDNFTDFYPNPHYEGRSLGILKGVAYKYEDGGGFRAGSYGGYNMWREELAKLAGYPAIEMDSGYGGTSIKHVHSVWANPVDGPFMELINFSDCEGVIGPNVSAKLAKDFAEFQEKASSHSNEHFVNIYGEFRKAFEYGSENGFVDFH